jgi:cytochrome P450
MAKRKPQRAETEYTAHERERYLFRTASEMRAILDRIDAKRKTRTTDVDDSIEIILDSRDENH